MSVVTELQKTIYSLLKADVTLAGMVAAIYENVPNDFAYPYINISDVNFRKWISSNTNGHEISLEIFINSKERGNFKLADIAERVIALFHDANFSITGSNLINIKVGNIDFSKNEKEKTRAVSINFRIVTQEI